MRTLTLRKDAVRDKKVSEHMLPVNGLTVMLIFRNEYPCVVGEEDDEQYSDRYQGAQKCPSRILAQQVADARAANRLREVHLGLGVEVRLLWLFGSSSVDTWVIDPMAVRKPRRGAGSTMSTTDAIDDMIW